MVKMFKYYCYFIYNYNLLICQIFAVAIIEGLSHSMVIIITCTAYLAKAILFAFATFFLLTLTN